MKDLGCDLSSVSTQHVYLYLVRTAECLSFALSTIILTTIFQPRNIKCTDLPL